jgi:PAS domain S-box-containing protein
LSDAQTRILIVEDEAIVAMDIRHRVEKLGYTVAETVTSGEDAIATADATRPDLVLMDIQLAGQVDGIEAAQTIRERYGTPVVFLTAFSDHESLERAKVVDAFGYILKPFEERELGIAIEMALYKERMQRRLSESREWLHGTVAALFDGVVTTDAAGKVLYLNERAIALTGWSEAEAVGRNVDEVVRAEPISKEEFATGILPNAVRLLRRDGSFSYVERRTSDISSPSTVPGEDSGISGRVLVLREVSDILSYERELREARDQAERALKTKSEFLANVTHELRTPLNSILGMADLAHSLAGDEQQKEYLGILKSSAENLLGLISSILELSRIDSGHVQLQPQEVDFDQLVESVVGGFALEAHNQGLNLQLAYDPETPAFVNADRARLAQVLSNLLANAVKYTERGGITVSVRPAPDEDNQVEISVADTGPGIPEDQQESVFQPFTQVDSGPTRRHGGAGIGLAVAREITELMGGRIALESTQGKGSTFTVYLPLERLPRDRQLGRNGQLHRSVMLVGLQTSERVSLKKWGEYLGVTVSEASDVDEAVRQCPDGVELVILSEDRAPESGGVSEVAERCGSAELFVLRPLGDEAPLAGAPAGVRYLSAPVMPSMFLKVLSGTHFEPQTAGNHRAAENHREERSQSQATPVSQLLSWFPVDGIDAAQLDELAAETRKLREAGGTADPRVDELLFRLSLAARRKNLEATEALLRELAEVVKKL